MERAIPSKSDDDDVVMTSNSGGGGDGDNDDDALCIIAITIIIIMIIIICCFYQMVRFLLCARISMKMHRLLHRQIEEERGKGKRTKDERTMTS